MDGICEKITNNGDVLESIFQYLNLKEQMKILKISKQFELTILQQIWRFRCKDISIQEKLHNFEIFNKKSRSKSSMNGEEIFEFLNLITSYMQHLKLYFGEKELMFRISFKFENLISLTFYYCYLSDKVLQQISKYSPKLESITLEKCRNFEGDSLQWQRDLELEVLKEMKLLKELNLDDYDGVTMEYQLFRKLCQLKNLKCLKVSSKLIWGKNKNIEEFPAVYTIENLSVGRFCETSWLEFSTKSLAQFKNLIEITLELSASLRVNDSVLNTLSLTCQNLKALTLKFGHLMINKWSSFDKLNSLNLSACHGLSGTNLRDILNMQNLQDLTILNTECQRTIKNLCYSSGSLKTLTLETSKNEDIVPAICNPVNHFEGLKALNWLQLTPNFTHKHYINQLPKLFLIFPNLQELHLEEQYLNFGDLKKFLHLKILRFNFFSSMSWLYLETLLKLPQLTHLNIHVPNAINYDIRNISLANSENGRDPTTACLGLSKNLLYLRIPLVVCRVAPDFWLSFLQMNSKLKLKVFTYYSVEFSSTGFFKRLIENRQFPSDLRTIDICGINVDCNLLRDNCEATFSKFDFQRNEQGELYFILQNPRSLRS